LAAETGDAIIGNLSFDAAATSQEVEGTSTKEDVGFDESITVVPKKSSGDAVMEEGNSSTTPI
jgi:hypothetical protein